MFGVCDGVSGLHWLSRGVPFARYCFWRSVEDERIKEGWDWGWIERYPLHDGTSGALNVEGFGLSR